MHLQDFVQVTELRFQLRKKLRLRRTVKKNGVVDDCKEPRRIGGTKRVLIYQCDRVQAKR